MIRDYRYSSLALFGALMMTLYSSCTRDLVDPTPATFPTTQEIFLDGFSGGLSYAAFGGSNVAAFDVDTEVSYKGTASMRFDVPDADDVGGGYAAGIFLAEGGRDLSGYNVLTFWAKASQSVSIDEIGFGFTFDEAKYSTTISNLSVGTAWKKYFIPMPDPSKLVAERGLLHYVDTPEEGKGYTFWLDEVRFEKLGTIAHPKPGILDGQNQIIEAETGDKLAIGGLFSTFNLRNGADQRVELAPNYFTFSSSSTSIAMADEMGIVSVLDSGSTVITAKLGTLDAVGSLTISSVGEAVKPSEPAPTPALSPDSVISLFSNAYVNVPVDTWNTGWEFSTAETQDLKINEDDIRRYKNLNFVGIEFSSQPIDASLMTHFHIDIWTPDPTDLPKAFKILLVDFGADRAFGGDDDSSHEIAIVSPQLKTGSWVSLEIPLSSFSGLTSKAQLAQMVFSGDLPNLFIDNVYFYIGGGDSGPTEPTEAAPEPGRAAEDVISVFSDAYPDLEGSDLNPDWGQATVVTEVSIDGNNTLSYSGLNYQGIQLASSTDVSGMDFLHIDYWTANSTLLNVFLISSGPVETQYSLEVPTDGWTGIDIPLSEFSSVDLTDLVQFKFDGNGSIFLDNIYFYKGSGSTGEPLEAAPTPTQGEATVVSIFSDVYDNLEGTDFNPDWGQATVVSEVSIAGNNTLSFSNLDYQGIQLAMGQDVSELNFLHIDFWTGNATSLNVFLISSGPVEIAYDLEVPTEGWSSVDIPLTAFDPVALDDVIQFKFEGNGNVFFDNIYFYSDGGGVVTEPGEAAPIPLRDSANVISIFSDVYPNLEATDFNPDWGQATVVSEVSISGDNALLLSNLNYQGIQLAMGQDVSGQEFLHIDFWSANSTTLSTFLISTGPIERAYALTVPSAGWSSVDIPLGAFNPVNLADVVQFKFEGNGDVYLDNIYFYSEAGSMSTEPAVPAPVPTLDSTDIISIFSDSYTNLMDTDFNPDWGQSTIFSEISIDGNKTILYSGLNYQGIQLGTNLDVSGMTHIHFDYWTSNSTELKIFLISSGPVETPKEIAVPTSGWVSLEIPLTDFTPVDLLDLIQLKLEGNGDIYIDNIYFRK